MGIDIPDIASVYHYAPTGTVVDYVQEIGRAARDTRLVPVGLGSVDYLPKDLNDMKKLFGMSAIRKDQILEVMKKIRAIYKAKGNNRNLTISPEDFKYIFVKSTGGTDEDELTNKVKTILLMIEKDFSSPKKLGYSPFVARPRNVFGRELLLVTEQQEETFAKSRLSDFFSKVCSLPNGHYSAVLNVNLVGIWEKYYRHMTYPSFKYSVFNLQKREQLQHASIFKGFVFASGIGIELKKDDNVKSILAQYRSILEEFRHFIDRYRMTEQQFTVNELGSYFAKALHIMNSAEARAFAQVVINSVFEVQKQKNMKFLTERETISDSSRRYTINQDISVFISTTNECVKACLEPSSNFFREENKITTFLPKSNSDLLSMRLSCLGIGEAKGLFNYQLIGGNDAQIYIRVNSVGALEKAINQGENYQNLIMNDVRHRHSLSVRMLQYLFSHPQPQKKAQERITEYSQWFWEQIENYFLGIIPPEVEGNL
jgi:ATP-dependent DNA helicase RecQ